MFCGISGPQATGKSTLISLLEPELPLDTIIIHDLHDKVYEDMKTIAGFNGFKEISKDRDYLLIYYGRLVEYYTDMIKAYKDYPGLVLFDGTHIDLLIYGMLNLWYHYPTQGVQEKLVHELLSVKKAMSVIYMTEADDMNYKLDRIGDRRYTTGFLKNRKTEIEYYEIFRDLPMVKTLPSTTVLECDKFIINDLKSRNLI